MTGHVSEDVWTAPTAIGDGTRLFWGTDGEERAKRYDSNARFGKRCRHCRLENPKADECKARTQ